MIKITLIYLKLKILFSESRCFFYIYFNFNTSYEHLKCTFHLKCSFPQIHIKIKIHTKKPMKKSRFTR